LQIDDCVLRSSPEEYWQVVSGIGERFQLLKCLKVIYRECCHLCFSIRDEKLLLVLIEVHSGLDLAA
jgi:hypothetical protein